MRNSLLALCCLCNVALTAQNDLLNSRQSSAYTYLYRISNQQAGAICRAETWQADPTFFHTLTDSFSTGSAFNRRLPAGHYLQTRIVKNELKMDLLSVQFFDVTLLDNGADLCIAVQDTLGRVLPDATVKVDERRIPFDAKTQSYRLPKSNKKGMLTVEHSGLVTYYDLRRSWNNPAVKRLLNNSPLRYVWRPVRFAVRLPADAVSSLVSGRRKYTTRRTGQFFKSIGRSIACILDEYACRQTRAERFADRWQGYMVFNKPKYLPGDTVKFKTFLVDQRGKPLRDSATVLLKKDGKDPVTLARMGSQQPGAFDFEFPLHDSLGLQLDKNYEIILQKEPERVYRKGQFRYEDYELRSTALALRTEGKNQFRGQEFHCHLKGTDENDLNLLDARVELTLRPLNVLTYHADKVFLPDTLWRHEQPLDPAGETAILLPDSIFPVADVEYRLHVVMLTADNERVTKEETLHFFHTRREFHHTLDRDTIRFEYRADGQSQPAQALLSGYDPVGNAVAERVVDLPFAEKINPHFAAYQLDDGLRKTRISLDSEPPLLQCLANRSADSLLIVADNPRQIPFRYFLYRHNREIARGYGADLRIARPSGEKEAYSISLQYLWGGRLRSENFAIGFQRNKLNVDIEYPALAYPGMETDFTVTVTDARGRPVPDADLTAYAVTQKFKPALPSLPSFEKKTKSRRLINTFSAAREQPGNLSALLDFDAWRDKTGLDTSEYYRFIFPGEAVYRYAYDAPDSLTQFAPFVMRRGAPQPMQVVYVDQKPVYFGWSQNYRPYSFRVTPGYHRIELRTTDRLIRMDSVYFEPHKKLIFSLNDSVQAPNIVVRVMPASLSDGEKSNLYRYIFPYRYSTKDQFPYLEQQSETILLLPEMPNRGDFPRRDWRYPQSLLAGPVMPNQTAWRSVGGVGTYFAHEPYFEYDPAPGLLKMRSVEPRLRYPSSLGGRAREELDAAVLTHEHLLLQHRRYSEDRRRNTARYSTPSVTPPGKARLLLRLTREQGEAWPLNVLLFKVDDSEFVRVYPGYVDLFHNLEAGQYRIALLYADAAYMLFDSIAVRSGGLNFISIQHPPLLPRDSFSTQFHELIEKNLFTPVPDQQQTRQELLEYQDRYMKSFSYTGPGRLYEGRITDENGEPLIGATVRVSNMNIGTVTDLDGFYSLFAPEGAILEVSYTGFESLRVNPGQSGRNDIALSGSGAQLSEVVVMGYRVPLIEQDNITAGQIKNLPTRNLNALAGSVAGISAEEFINIRGSRSEGLSYYVDGIRVQGNMSGLDIRQIHSVEYITGAEALAVFGPEAAGGAMLITTKAGAKGAQFDAAFLEAAGEASSIRSNFSDYAFWQPRLRTDREGRATFRVAFPDDITQWRAFVPAMTGKKQSGVGEARIRSFKPVAARLSVPRFLVAGDTAFAIGKALNYTSDTLNLSTRFAVNEVEAAPREHRIADAATDSVLLAPLHTDSLAVKFVVEKPDGYFDGELRSVPVFPKGLERAAGQFFVLEGDTTIVVALPDSLGETLLYARADVLDVVQEDIARLIHYEYDCNEQMASRLKALLAEEQIAAFKGRPFERKAQVARLIDRLEKNRNEQGLWGWWNRSASVYWISNHVIETLAQARSKGYKVQALPRQFAEEAVWELESTTSNARKLEVLQLMSSFEIPIDYKAYLPFIEKDSTLHPLDRFRLIGLQQLHGLPWQRDSLMAYRQETLFGNVFFSATESELHPSQGTLQLTPAAYRILQRDTTAAPDELRRIRNYLLEQRGAGVWLNTYQTAQIVDLLTADLKKTGADWQPPALQLSGAAQREVSQFPFELRLPPGDTLRVQKTGDYPVYFTAYQRYWDEDARASGEHFEVKSFFAGGSDTLQAGKPERLVVEVTAAKAAQYVLIEIPIPGSCSYESKKQYYRGEVHREYFRHKTAIFCERLGIGTHRFEVELLPRYSGVFALNPAKVELMYFPVFQANAAGRRVRVR
ncbi:MAG: carboxypeptidase-like regulatory domain-containing protein [Saprospiraceae bacterium]|nr:carboxypeptidase-like regulatory domain-containing protein [Saprospiraceae bacterium]